MSKTKTEFAYYAKAQNIEAGGCFAITFIRPVGTNPVSVNGYPLAEGQDLRIGQNVGDMDTSQYNIVFYSGTADNQIHVIKILPA